MQINKSFVNRDNRNETRGKCGVSLRFVLGMTKDIFDHQFEIFYIFIGFKGLLHRLINIQNETLGINKQRLKIERQRFEFEQSIGKKLLNVLTKMASNSANDTLNNAASDVDRS